MKFYICEHCGNIVTFVENKGVPVMCCGQRMTELVPGTVEASQEKHIPVAEQKDGIVTVKVGAAEHPMAEEHYIQWIALETEQGCQIKYLRPGQKPQAVFALAEGDAVVSVYAYCNLHGLWKK